MHAARLVLIKKRASELWLGSGFYMIHIRTISWQSAGIHEKEQGGFLGRRGEQSACGGSVLSSA